MRLTRRTAGVRLPRMRRHTADPEDYASMLNPIVGIIKLRADAADFRPQRVRHHLVEPVAMNHFEIVVEQSNERSIRLAHAIIVDRGKIEFAGETNHPDRGFLVRSV